MISAPDTVVVASPTELGVSDLVLGSRGTHLSWIRDPEDTVLFNPVGAFRADLPLTLFYEVLGVPQGTTYRTEIKVTRPRALGPISTLFGGSGSAFTLKHEEQSFATRMPFQPGLDISRLKPGNYTLEVTIDVGGQKVRRRAPFQVLGAPKP